jgi:membrane protein implicated in regulation of membrane protease activity
MRGKQFTAYAIISTLLEEVAIAVIGFWVLPIWIHIPVWVVVLIMVGWAAYNILTYRPSKKALDKEIPTPGEAMIGCEGKAKTRLAPDGMVQVHGGLWKARATDCTIDNGDEIVVVGIKRLTLFVAPLGRSEPETSKADEKTTSC